MLITVLAFIFILGFSVTIHEIGHFIAAKLAKIPVEKFSIGYGPPLIRIKIGETDFRIAVFPLGGYVKMMGDFEGEVLKPRKAEIPAPDVHEQPALVNERTGKSGFYEASTSRKVLVVICGPLANIGSAFLVLAVIFSFFGAFVTPFLKIKVAGGSWAAEHGLVKGDSLVALNNQPLKVWEDVLVSLSTRDSNTLVIVRDQEQLSLSLPPATDNPGISPLIPAVIGTVRRNGPAGKAGMKQGDMISSINDIGIEDWEQLVDMVRANRGNALNIVWLSNGDEFQANVKPREHYDPVSKDTVGEIGVMMALARQKLALPRAVLNAGQRTVEYLLVISRTLVQLITGKISRRNLGGPIAIFRLSGESASWGFEYLLSLLALISVNLGLINLFPLPAFDGGHALLAIIESVRKRKFSRKTHLVIQQIGYALILILIILVFYNDLTR